MDNYAHAGGYRTIAHYKQTVIGSANVEYKLSSGTGSGKLIVGKGISETARANCLRVTDTGVYASGSYSSSGADYAEFFEWLDGNPEQEDRAGLFVTLEGEKIRLARPDDDFILGIVSGEPSVCGDVYDDQWKGMYLYDIYGRPLWEDVEVPDETIEEPSPENPDETITRPMRPAPNGRNGMLWACWANWLYGMTGLAGRTAGVLSVRAAQLHIAIQGRNTG